MAPKIKTKNLTVSQEKIVKDLIAEFETLNAQENTDSKDLCAYIDNTMNERKRKREDVDRKNQLTLKRNIEYLNALVSDILPIAKRYHVAVVIPNYLTTPLEISLQFHTPDKNNRLEYKRSKQIRVALKISEVEGKTLYGEMDKNEIKFFTDPYTYCLVDKASLPKKFADEIIRFRKDYNIYE